MEFFEASRKAKGYRNMVGDPMLQDWALGKRHSNFCGCGLAASGEEPPVEEPPQDQPPVKNAVMNLQAWTYIRTGLMLVGAFVIFKYVYTNMIKK